MSNSCLFDPIRDTWVKQTPEEIVRQNILKKLLSLGFQKSLISVEKQISLLPHVQTIVNNDRRADILCFAQKIHPQYPLYPLLMIECKAEEFSQKTLRQVAGYNVIVKALFLCIACKNKVRTYWQEKDSFQSVDFIPSFEELMSAIPK